MKTRITIVLFVLTLCAAAFGELSCSGSAKQDVNNIVVPPDGALLSWDANVESDLAGYKIHYGTASGLYDQVVSVQLTDIPSPPYHLLTGLPKGATYYFVVTAFDTSGNESDPSNEVSKEIE